MMGAAGLARSAYASRKKDLQQDRDPDETIKVAAAIKTIVESTKEDLTVKEDSVGFWAMVKRRLEVCISPTTDEADDPGASANAAKAQRSAITAVKSLAKNGAFSIAMKNDAAKARVVVPLTRLMHFGANEGVKAAAAEALGLLVALAHTKNQDLALKAGAVDMLLPLLKSTSRSATRVAAARCLACQVRHHSPSMNAVRHQGGLLTLVEMLQDSNRPDENEAGLETAGWLMEGNRLNQTGFGESGLLVPLIDFLTEEDCAENAKSTLWVVSMLVKGHDRNLKLATEDYEVMPLLVRHLEPSTSSSKAKDTSSASASASASSVASTQQYAVSALIEFVRGDAGRAQRAVDYGAPKLLRRLTRPRTWTWRSLLPLRRPPDSRLQRAARHALATIAGKGAAPPDEPLAKRKKRSGSGRRKRSSRGEEHSWWATLLSESAPTLVGVLVVALAVWGVDYLNAVTGFNYGFGEAGVYNTLMKWVAGVERTLSASNQGGDAKRMFSTEDFAEFLNEETAAGVDVVADGLVDVEVGVAAGASNMEIERPQEMSRNS